MREIASSIGEGLSLPVRSIGAEEAGERFDWIAAFVQLDAPALNAITRQTLGWEPRKPGLIADLRHAGDFAAKARRPHHT